MKGWKALNIVVVGLGLIGGSICKCLKKHTRHCVYGWDTDKETLKEALSQEAIDGAADVSDLHSADLTVICLYPEQTIQFVTDHLAEIQKGSILIDTCGIKSGVVAVLDPLLSSAGIRYVGTHPMAGREFSGFAYSVADLFDPASLILTVTEQTQDSAVKEIAALAEEMHFREVVVSTPEEHDRIIAYTSQLAHVVSNAYIKSPTERMERGFSAGSFKDLTRVARLNPEMWTSLFLLNREPLLFEINTIICLLNEYRSALERQDREELFRLLEEGSEIKKRSQER